MSQNFKYLTEFYETNYNRNIFIGENMSDKNSFLRCEYKSLRFHKRLHFQKIHCKAFAITCKPNPAKVHALVLDLNISITANVFAYRKTPQTVPRIYRVFNFFSAIYLGLCVQQVTTF